MNSRTWTLISLLVVALAVAACGGSAKNDPTPTPTRAAHAARPTFTLTPTKAVPTPVPATVVPSPTAPPPTVAPTNTAAPVAAAFTVNKASVNVREGPGSAYQLLGTITQGQEMAITGKDSSGSWWQFNYNGDPGWVTADLVTVNAAAADVALAANIPALPTRAPQPTARPAAPAAPALPAQPPAPATQFMVNGTNPRVNTNPRVTVWCLVWNSSRNALVAGTLRVTGGGVTKEQPFEAAPSTANGGLPSAFKYSTGCKVEITPPVEGQYTAWIISGGQVISDPAVLQVSGDIREFATVWQQK